MDAQYAEDDGEIVDPEIEALLDFEPVPRAFARKGSWTPPLQREFIRRLARTGSPNRACEEMGKDRHGLNKVYKSPDGESFRAAWTRAVEIAERREEERLKSERLREPIGDAPYLDRRRMHGGAADGPLPGQVMNEYGEWEDESSLNARAEEARESISMKLLRARRHYLLEISGSPGKRAAFEMLTELPIDWEAAERFEPQPDEPWARPNMREPDMLLTAENGWLGATAHGPDKMEELRKAIDEYRAEEGLEPVEWDSESAED